MSINIDSELVRQLTDTEDNTDILSEDALTNFIGLAERKVKDKHNLSDEEKSDAGVWYACKLVADKLRGADSISQDGDISIEKPEHYEKEFKEVVEGDSSGSVIMRAGNGDK